MILLAGKNALHGCLAFRYKAQRSLGGRAAEGHAPALFAGAFLRFEPHSCHGYCRRAVWEYIFYRTAAFWSAGKATLKTSLPLHKAG